MWRTNFAPAGLRGRVILGKGNRMEELIKRLERVIQTGAPDKDGMHPISAETVLEVVKELSEHGTNLASLGTDCISREQYILATGNLKMLLNAQLKRCRNLFNRGKFWRHKPYYHSPQSRREGSG